MQPTTQRNGGFRSSPPTLRLKVAREMSSGTVVVVLPDCGDRYLSTTLFMSTCAKCPP